MYVPIYYGASEQIRLGEYGTIDEAIVKAKGHLSSLNQSRSEEDMVVLIWNACACEGVVLDDANGLCFYQLRAVGRRK